MPHASTFTRTCPGPGCGMSRSTNSQFPPGLPICAAFMVFINLRSIFCRDRAHVCLPWSLLVVASPRNTFIPLLYVAQRESENASGRGNLAMLCCGAAEPVLESRRAEARVFARGEALIVQLDAEVACVDVRGDLPCIPVCPQELPDELVETYRFGTRQLDRAVQRFFDCDVRHYG